jgi:hypothetical protein
VILDRPGLNRSDEYIRIGIPATADAPGVERGIMQAIVQLLTPQPQPVLSAWKRIRRWLAALIYANCLILSAQIIPRWPIIQSYAVASLPTFGVRNRVAVVTDALSSTSCLIGGGTTVLLCRDTGTTWEVLSGSGGGGGGSVDSVFGRTGVVVAAGGDYTAAQVTGAVDTGGSYANPSWITSLDYAKLTGAPTVITRSQIRKIAFLGL